MIGDAMPEAPKLEAPAWLLSLAAWLTPQRLRAQAFLLALCLWGVCAVDFSSPGLFDRAGNIKFQDFLPLYVSARLVAQGRSNALYDQRVAADEMRAILRQPIGVVLPNLYGPQLALFFVPLTRFSFSVAARIWVALSLLAYFACVYLLWRNCPGLKLYSGIVLVSALAFPPLFHFFVRGQISVLLLLCLTLAFLGFRSGHTWMAGLALGLLIFKPQFLVAIPLIFLLARAWQALAGVILSALAQFALTWIYFGPPVMRSYLDALLHMSRWLSNVELSLAPIQMHSLRSFWTLLIPRPDAAFALYILSSVVVIAAAAAIWRSSSPLALRFSALTLAAVLVNPHLFVYDLLVLAPALLLLADVSLASLQLPSSAAIRVLLYLSFVLPLLGPLSRWTHLQLSVVAFSVLLWVLWRAISRAEVL